MDTIPVTAPMNGTVMSVDVAPGQSVPAGTPSLVLESMKMEHVVSAPAGGIVRRVAAGPGEVVEEGRIPPDPARHMVNW